MGVLALALWVRTAEDQGDRLGHAGTGGSFQPETEPGYPKPETLETRIRNSQGSDGHSKGRGPPEGIHRAVMRAATLRTGFERN